jgi:two-component system, sensor histidine kinase and response regulator
MLLGSSTSHRVAWLAYLIAVCAVAARSGLGASLFAAALSLIAFDFFDETPNWSFIVSDYETMMTFAVVLAIAVFISWRTRQLGELEIAKARAESLLETKTRMADLEIAKARAESALAAKNRFLATVAHEVRTPMVGVIGLVELLSLKDLGAEPNEMVQMSLDSSKQLLQTLNYILEASQLEIGQIQLEFRQFAVRALLGDIGQLISREAQEKQLRVSVYCEDKVPEYVCGDELRVRQVLLNLAFNAVKYTDKGDVRITAEFVQQQNDTTTIRFSVIDTGIGISEQQQSEMFQPFAQAQDPTTRVSGGLGLGLTISKGLVSLMGGQMNITSRPGDGSTFWFDVPFTDAPCKS